MASTPEGIDQVGQEAAGSFEAESFAQHGLEVKTWKFSRTFQHYADNSPNFPGLHINPGKNPSATFDEAWQWIPYNQLRASVSPREWRELSAGSRAIRVTKFGFRVHNAQTISQGIAPTGALNITSQFVSQPFFMYAVDHAGYTWDMITNSKDPETMARNRPNEEMTASWPESYEAGRLKKCVWELGPDFVRSLGTVTGGAQMEKTSARGTINTLNGLLDIKFSNNGEFSHTWSAGPEGMRWYAIGKFLSTPFTDGTYKKQYPFPQDISSPDEFGDIESNQATDINRNFRAPPPPCYMKIVPIHHMNGPLLVNASFFITYHCEVQTLAAPARAILTQNLGTWNITKPINSYGLAQLPKWNLNRDRDIYRYGKGYSYKEPDPNPSKFNYD